MKVAMIGARNFPARHGGLEVVVEELVEELRARLSGVTVTVVAGSTTRIERDDGDLVVRSGIGGKYTDTISAVLLQAPAVRRLEADVLHVQGVGPAIGVVLLRRLYGNSRILVTVHAADWQRDKWPRVGRVVFRSFTRVVLSRADHVVAVSGSVAGSCHQLHRSKQIEIIPNGIRLSGVEDVPVRERRSAVVGRLVPEKNLEYLFAVYNDEVASRLGPLLVVGGGASSYASEYESHLRRIAPSHVEFLGSLDRGAVIDVVSHSGLYLSASKVEGQPIALLEAIASSTPVMVSDIPAHREVVRDASMLLPLGDATAARDVLLSVADGDADSVSRAANLRERIRTEHNWSRLAVDYGLLYSELAGVC